MKGSGRSFIYDTTSEFAWRTEETHENFSQNIRSPSQDSNRLLSEYKSEALPLEPTCSVSNFRSNWYLSDLLIERPTDNYRFTYHIHGRYYLFGMY
jgi:hypothetical protein